MILKLLLTLLPSILWFFYLNYKNEQILLSLKFYFFALLMVIPVLIIEKTFVNLFDFSSSILATLILSFIIIALVEEIAKYFALRQGLNYVELEKLTLRQGIICGLTVGFGFAQGENILYALFFAYETILLRILVTPFLHAFFSGIVGFYLFKAIEQEDDNLFYRGILIAVFLHGIYDFLLLS